MGQKLTTLRALLPWDGLLFAEQIWHYCSSSGPRSNQWCQTQSSNRNWNGASLARKHGCCKVRIFWPRTCCKHHQAWAINDQSVDDTAAPHVYALLRIYLSSDTLIWWIPIGLTLMKDYPMPSVSPHISIKCFSREACENDYSHGHWYHVGLHTSDVMMLNIVLYSEAMHYCEMVSTGGLQGSLCCIDLTQPYLTWYCCHPVKSDACATPFSYLVILTDISRECISVWAIWTPKRQ